MSLPEWRLRAAAIIERDGWCQGSYVDGTGRCCVVGAILLAQGVEPEALGDSDFATASLAAQAVSMVAADVEDFVEEPEVGEDPIAVLAEWNDMPHRDRADVLQLLRGEGVAP